jgi:hypothetical protein
LKDGCGCPPRAVEAWNFPEFAFVPTRRSFERHEQPLVARLSGPRAFIITVIMIVIRSSTPYQNAKIIRGK